QDLAEQWFGDKKGLRATLRVSDGYLFGFNRGEWGGTLIWRSSDGRTGQTVLSDNIVGLQAASQGVLVMTGIMSAGDLIRLERRSEGWAPVVSVALGGEPQAMMMTPSEDPIFVVTNTGLVRIAGERHVQRLNEVPWLREMPQSIATAD